MHYDLRFHPGKRYGKRFTQASLRECRNGGPAQTMPTIMARYGTQHTFDESYLEQYGLLAHLRVEESQIRFWSPMEIGLAHCALTRFFLHGDCSIAWMQAGNMIFPAHALLLLQIVINGLGCPREVRNPFADTWYLVQPFRLRHPELAIWKLGDNWLLCHKSLSSYHVDLIRAWHDNLQKSVQVLSAPQQ